MYDYMKALHARFCREPELQKVRAELEQAYREIKARLGQQDQETLLQLADLENELREETSLASFVAGFQQLNVSLFEAGAIDGIRNRFQEFVKITIPAIGPSLLFSAVMQISSSFSVGRICMALTGFPSTDYSTSTIVTHILDYGTLRYEMGYACAIATVLFLMMLLTNQVIRRLLRGYTN